MDIDLLPDSHPKSAHIISTCITEHNPIGLKRKLSPKRVYVMRKPNPDRDSPETPERNGSNLTKSGHSNP